MLEIAVRERHASPGPRPQPLAFIGGTLWAGSWGTSHLYGIDARPWSVLADVPAPGQPFGLAAVGDGLRVVVSDGGEADDRSVYRFVPGQGFDLSSKAPCPDHTGSHLAADGDMLYLVQAHFGRILALDANLAIVRAIALPSRVAGLSAAGGTFHAIAADEEFEELHFAALDLSGDEAAIAPIASLPNDSRGLAFDGSAWWTCRRESNEILCFSVPVAAG